MSKNQEPENYQNSSDLWYYVKQWRDFKESKLNKLGERQLDHIRTRNLELARFEAAKELIEKRKPIADLYEPGSNAQLVVRMIATGVGAVMYVTVASIFASNLGLLRTPVALIGGGVISFLVDKLATRSITNREIKENTLNSIESMRSENITDADNNVYPLKRESVQEKINLIRELEGSSLHKTTPTNAIGAITLNVIEYITAFWLMSGITIYGGNIPFLVIPIVSALPVAFTWGFAIYQKDNFQLPKYYHRKMPSYEKYLLTAESASGFAVDRKLEDYLIDAEIKNILSSNPRHETPKIARDYAHIDYYKEKTHRLKTKITTLRTYCKEEVLQVTRKLKADLDQIPFQYPEIEMSETQGRNCNEIQKIQIRRKEAKAQWIIEQSQRLENLAHSEITAIQKLYEIKIEESEKKIEELVKNIEELKKDIEYLKIQLTDANPQSIEKENESIESIDHNDVSSTQQSYECGIKVEQWKEATQEIKFQNNGFNPSDK